MNRIYILHLLALAATTTLLAQDAQPETGAIALQMVPREADSEEAMKVINEIMTSMNADDGCLKTFLSKGDIMSPAGPTDYQLVMTAHWTSFVDFATWTDSENARKLGADLSKLGGTMILYEVESP